MGQQPRRLDRRPGTLETKEWQEHAQHVPTTRSMCGMVEQGRRELASNRARFLVLYVEKGEGSSKSFSTFLMRPFNVFSLRMQVGWLWSETLRVYGWKMLVEGPARLDF